jgi:hypothetical protein
MALTVLLSRRIQQIVLLPGRAISTSLRVCLSGFAIMGLLLAAQGSYNVALLFAN